jgi:hypothetical protein
MAASTIATISEENVDNAEVLDLAPGQERYVAPVTASRAQAFVTQQATLEFPGSEG